MSFDEKIAALIQRLPKLVDHLETEEATKNALIMPFIAALGYDIFNPQEVIPEFTADVGTKKGEKVDYAILSNGEVILIFECKKAGTDLGQAEKSQLFRYFSVTKARIAVLTNGTQYYFYSDLEASNKMDSRSFLELDLEDPRPHTLQEVKKLAKDNFDLERILSTASELKYTSAIKKVLSEQYDSPDEEFCKYFFSKTNPGGRFVGNAKESFMPLVKKALNQFVSEKINDRLRSALEPEGKEADPEVESPIEEEVVTSNIVTTEEELEAFRIIRAIVTKVIDPERVAYRDVKTYMSILFDDNNRKPVCRLWFNSRQKYLGTFDADRNETKNPIENLSDIYQYGEQIVAAVQRYIS
ncbi:type I restriction endonuclease [Spirulina major]|uniref:type I restriction endonuclease n=1 Tax=Spirulina major TaxID=270636 RepID=UPI00093509DD|nr:type I restriction endonuclease [Spirulina major]